MKLFYTVLKLDLASKTKIPFNNVGFMISQSILKKYNNLIKEIFLC